MAIPPWKLNLQPASYKGVVFHVDVDTRSGGRRKVLHEFPKRDLPYLEDMGRHARRFIISGYVIGPDYQAQRDDLVAALEDEADGELIHPTYQIAGNVGVDTYSVTERRERGGWAEFEVAFLESGQALDAQVQADTPSATNNAVDQGVNSDFGNSSDITALV